MRALSHAPLVVLVLPELWGTRETLIGSVHGLPEELEQAFGLTGELPVAVLLLDEGDLASIGRVHGGAGAIFRGLDPNRWSARREGSLELRLLSSVHVELSIGPCPNVVPHLLLLVDGDAGFALVPLLNRALNDPGALNGLYKGVTRWGV